MISLAICARLFFFINMKPFREQLANQLLAVCNSRAGPSATNTSNNMAELRTVPDRMESAPEMGACFSASTSRLSLTLWIFLASCRTAFAGMQYTTF